MSWEDILKERKKRGGQSEDPDSPVAIEREKTYQERYTKEIKLQLEADKKSIVKRIDIVLNYLDQYNEEQLKNLQKATDSLHDAIVDFDVEIFTLHQQSDIDITDDLPL